MTSLHDTHPRVDHELARPFSRPDKLKDPLYVVTPVFNSKRFRSRWRLYADFKKMVAEAGAILYTVEIAFGDRDFAVTSASDPHNLQLRTMHELWLKEAAINLMVQRLPRDWKYVAWVDADCHFTRYDWADETKHLLQHYPIIQMWSQLLDTNSHHETFSTFNSFVWQWWKNGCTIPKNVTQGCYSGPPHTLVAGYPGAPGLAWACERSAWDQFGGLIDYCILGAGDSYMAYALTGEAKRFIGSKHGKMGQMILQFQDRLANSQWHERPIMGNVGYMPGSVIHYSHGPKANRLYGTREEMLYRNKYDPDLDLKRDWQGLYQLTNYNPQLRRDVQGYFNQRSEDDPVYDPKIGQVRG